MNRLFFLSMFLMGLMSCDDSLLCDCTQSTGPVLTEIRNISGFTKIRVEEDVNLIISIDTFYRVSVVAGKNLLGEVVTRIDDSLLFITNNNRCNWVRNLQNKVNVHITLPFLEYIGQWGTGTINSEGSLKVHDLLVEVFDGTGSIDLDVDADHTWFKLRDGAADFIVRGTTAYNYIYSNGYGPINCLDLKSSQALIINQGTNDCSAWVTQDLDARITYIGNIYYKGDPTEIKSSVSGSGKLIKL